MEQEKQIFEFLFEKFKQNKKSEINITNFVFELSSTKEKINEILKPILSDRTIGAKNFNTLIEKNDKEKDEKDFLNFTYFLFMVWNFYTEMKEEDREIILEFLNN